MLFSAQEIVVTVETLRLSLIFNASDFPKRQYRVNLHQVFQKRPGSALIGGSALIMANTV